MHTEAEGSVLLEDSRVCAGLSTKGSGRFSANQLQNYNFDNYYI